MDFRTWLGVALVISLVGCGETKIGIETVGDGGIRDGGDDNDDSIDEDSRLLCGPSAGGGGVSNVDGAPKLQPQWPKRDQIFIDPVVAIKGTAHDDEQIRTVDVMVQKTATKEWLQADGVSFGATTHEFTVYSSNEDVDTVAWALDSTLQDEGDYGVMVRATDASGKTDETVRCFQRANQVLSGGPSFLTLILSRTQFVDSPQCQPSPGAKTIFDVADALQSRSMTPIGTLVMHRQAEPGEPVQRRCQSNFQLSSSWDDVDKLRDDYGWTFAIHSKPASNVRFGDLNDPDLEFAESCGALADLESRGHSRAWGLFAYDGNNVDLELQNNLISTCFSYGRRYTGSGINLRTSLNGAPWLARTWSIAGGYCNDPEASCFDVDIARDRRRYRTREELVSLLAGHPDHWVILQFYRFVEGKNPSGPGSHYDCTGHPDQHWTARSELYCLNDFLAALDQMPHHIQVVSPADVAEAWGRGNPSLDGF